MELDEQPTREQITEAFFINRASTKRMIADSRRNGDAGTVFMLEHSLTQMEKSYTRFLALASTTGENEG